MNKYSGGQRFWSDYFKDLELGLEPSPMSQSQVTSTLVPISSNWYEEFCRDLQNSSKSMKIWIQKMEKSESEINLLSHSKNSKFLEFVRDLMGAWTNQCIFDYYYYKFLYYVWL